MKRIVSINLGNVGSTGRIMRGIAASALSEGFKVYQAYPISRNVFPLEEDDIVIGNLFGKVASQRLAYLTGYNGCYSWFSTKKFLKKLDEIKPDILHFHNLHNSYINLPMLFNYVKKNHIRVIWTLHDCWSFTGQCPYFTLAGCDKWKTGCGGCTQLSVYPASRVDRTQTMWKLKKMWFTGVEDMTIVTPSEWLAGLVKQSFLSEYPVKVINNGIDLDVFKPVSSDFREKHGISSDGGVFLILGIAFDWSVYKGKDVFIELAKRLPDNFRIIMVGTNDRIDQNLPSNVISIHKTNNIQELVEIYSAVDLLVNPTREDNFPTVNIEALSCGTPVVTFETNGSPEILDDKCGSVVPYGDIDAMEQEILRIAAVKPFSSEACIQRAQRYRRDDKYKEYVKLYES